MTAMLFRLLSIAAPAAALPALLAGFLAAAAGISLIASAAWIIASAALAPPLSALALAITCVRAASDALSFAIWSAYSPTVSPSAATRRCSRRPTAAPPPSFPCVRATYARASFSTIC